MPTFISLWEFIVPPERVAAFEHAYGPEGEWVQLFRRDPSYIGTELFRDAERPGRFVTVDRWATQGAFLSFRERFRSEYDAIDARCETLTTEERCIGNTSDGVSE